MLPVKRDLPVLSRTFFAHLKIQGLTRIASTVWTLYLGWWEKVYLYFEWSIAIADKARLNLILPQFKILAAYDLALHKDNLKIHYKDNCVRQNLNDWK